MRVSVFGLGYVGCVSAACFAKAGHQVVGVDVNPDKVNAINAGVSPVVEPGLDTLIGQVVRAGRLRATRSAEDAVEASDMALVCVGTPGQANGRLQVSALAGVAEAIGRAARDRVPDFTVVLRSTVLPGTTDEVLLPQLVAGSGGSGRFRITVNPEFMPEGPSPSDFAPPPFTRGGRPAPSPAPAVRPRYPGGMAPFI